MAESSEKNPLSRRDFLKMAGVFGGAVALTTSLRSSVPEIREPLQENILSLAALRVKKNIEGESDFKRSLRILKQLEKTLASEPINLVITPEYSFQMTYGLERNFEPMPLVINHSGSAFTVDKLKSHNATRIIVENAQSLANQYKSNLLLATFYDPEESNLSHTAAIYIGETGEITGIKRKSLPPKGKFEVKKGGRALKVLPMICGEVWEKRDINPTTGEMRSIPPNWVKDGAPYDIFTHSIAQGDVDFNRLVELVQEIKISGNFLGQDSAWLTDSFQDYYSGYFPFLAPNAPIVISDWGMTGIFQSNLNKIDNYSDHGDYSVAKIQVAGENTK